MLKSKSLLALSFSLLAVVACDEPVDDTDSGAELDSGDIDDTSDTEDTSDTDTTAPGFAIAGTTLDLAAQAPAAEGLCIDVADPSAAFAGGDLDILASSTVAADGSFRVEGVETDSVLGLFLFVSDCDSVAPVMPTASGVPFAAYENLSDGDELTGLRAVVVSQAMQQGMSQSFTAAGYTGDITTEGVVIGFVRDSSGNPVEGASVACGNDCAAYYADADNADGMFTSATTGLNTSTAALTGGMFAVPNGPLTSYTATHSTHTFPAVTFGGMAGLATIMAFEAE